MANRFAVEDWIERLAQLLPPLVRTQEPFLCEFQERHACVIDLRDGKPPPFPLDDLCSLYNEVRHGRLWGLEAHYAPLRAVLDPVRYAILSHPTLERVAVTGRVIGDNDFWMEILGSGSRISPNVLIAGLMARAAKLPNDRIRSALRELHAFLSPVGNGAATDVLGNLDEACHAVLFHGLELTENVEMVKGFELIPYEELLRFVDQDLLEEFTPPGTGFHGWNSVGAVVRRFRWRPRLCKWGNVGRPNPSPLFLRDSVTLLDLLAVSHSTSVVPLAFLSNRIVCSAGRLLGLGKQSPGFYKSWSTQGISGFNRCPAINPESLVEVREAFRNRGSMRYASLAPIVTRLSESLTRHGRLAVADRVQDVAMALERMHVPDEGNIGRKLRGRTAQFLGTNEASRNRIKDDVRKFYEVRSAIVHNRLHRLTPERVHSAFVRGLDLARRSLFKMLRTGLPESWVVDSDDGSPKTGSDEEIQE